MGGKGVDIGVIDSILHPPQDTDIESLTTRSSNNYIASDEALARFHGFLTTRIISSVADGSNYHFYRIISNDRKFKVNNYLKALKDAADDDLDIINFSAGKHHTDCGGRCRPCEATKEVVRDGTTVVAGAGNDVENEGKSMYCPALDNEVISVGAFQTFCDYTIQNEQMSPPYRPNPLEYPPNCYLLEHPDNGDECELYGQQMCGQAGCGPTVACDDYKNEELWSGNVDFSTSQPHLFAPSHCVYLGKENNLRYDEGTSYSTAYVSGSLAGIFGALKKRSQPPSPNEVRSGIAMIAKTVGSTSWRKYDAETVQDHLEI